MSRRNRRSNRTEPPELPPEPPVAVEPEPVVRAILVGPAGETQNRLFELLSAQQEIEIFALCERADEALATLFNLPARRRTAVLLDAKLPGTHDAGWLIRRLRERHPVLRLFAYCEEPDDDAMESVALAGVDEVLVVVGEDADRETLDAFERQFDLRPGAPTERVPVVEEEAAKLAYIVAAVTAVLDPGLVVLGGGIGGNADLLAEPMRRTLAATIPVVPDIVAGQLGEDAVLAGAISTALTTARDLVFDRRGLRPVANEG